MLGQLYQARKDMFNKIFNQVFEQLRQEYALHGTTKMICSMPRSSISHSSDIQSKFIKNGIDCNFNTMRCEFTFDLSKLTYFAYMDHYTLINYINLHADVNKYIQSIFLQIL